MQNKERRMKILKSSEKKKIIEKLKKQYGICEVPHLLLRFGKERIRAYSGSLSKEDLNNLDKNLRLEIAGIYFLHDYGDEIRLSLDALHIFKRQITKNIVKLNKRQADDWFKGLSLIHI